jgi:hypothetical protein
MPPQIQPVKKLSPRIIIALIIGVLLIGGGLFFTRKHTNNVALVAKQQEALTSTISEINGKDSNGNGIADWEETLYGLNPEKDGAKNKAIIDAKKKELGQTEILQSSPALNETEKFSREFFATIMALQQAGTLTPEAIAGLATSLSNSIAGSSKDAYKTSYTSANVKTVPASTSATTKYLTALGVILKKYKDQDIGVEMQSIAIALSNNDPRPLLALPDIATSYTNLTKALIALPVPTSLSGTHLILITSTDIIAKTLPDIKQILANPLLALPALAEYSKQNALFTKTLLNLTGTL